MPISQELEDKHQDLLGKLENSGRVDREETIKLVKEAMISIRGETNPETKEKKILAYENLRKKVLGQYIEILQTNQDELKALLREVRTTTSVQQKEEKIQQSIKEKDISEMSLEEAAKSLDITNNEYKNYGSSLTDKIKFRINGSNEIPKKLSDITSQTKANLLQEELIKKVLGGKGGYNNEYIQGFDTSDKKVGNYLMKISDFETLIKGNISIKDINSKLIENYLKYLRSQNSNAKSFKKAFIEKFGEEKARDISLMWSGNSNTSTSSEKEKGLAKQALENIGFQSIVDDIVNLNGFSNVEDLKISLELIPKSRLEEQLGIPPKSFESSQERAQAFIQIAKESDVSKYCRVNAQLVGIKSVEDMWGILKKDKGKENLSIFFEKSGIAKEKSKDLAEKLSGKIDEYFGELRKEGNGVINWGNASSKIVSYINTILKENGTNIELKPEQIKDISDLLTKINKNELTSVLLQETLKEDNANVTHTQNQTTNDYYKGVLDGGNYDAETVRHAAEAGRMTEESKKRKESIENEKRKAEEKLVTATMQHGISEEMTAEQHTAIVSAKTPEERTKVIQEIIQSSSKLQEIIQESDKKIADIKQSYGVTTPVDTLKEMGIKTDNSGNIARVQEQNIYKDQQINTTDDGKIYFSVGENKKVEITNQEATLIQNNETAKENLLHFYSVLQDCGLEQIWGQRETIFKAISNQKGMAFDTRDGDYLSKNEVKIFLQAIVKSIAPQFKNQGEIEAILNAENEQDIIYFIKNYNGENNLLGPAKDKFGRTKLVEIFSDIFFPQEKQRVFQFAQFESAIRS